MSLSEKIMREEREPYYIGEVSSSEEEEGAGKSSEDEIEVLMESDLQTERKRCSSSSEDEFEKEMQLELDTVIKSSTLLDKDFKKVSDSVSRSEDLGARGKKITESNGQEKEFYHEDYFSSGSDEDENKVGGEPSKSDERRKMMKADDLFYDPDMDDEDEQWVKRQRQIYRQKGSRVSNELPSQSDKQVQSSRAFHSGRTKGSPTAKPHKTLSSDAILSCPACLITLCIDCQRHEVYHNQYRAMFVMNCDIVKDEVLRYDAPSQIGKPGKRKRKGQKGKLVAVPIGNEMQQTQQGGKECYKPVRCTECNTEVAVYDEDEVYHFFNIIASHA